MWHDLLTALHYRYISGIGVPILLSLLGIFGKKLVRGKGWKRSDFYLGVEFTLAALSAALVNIFDLLRPNRVRTEGDNTILLANFIVALFSLLMFMFVLSLHQDWESSDATRGKQLLWLAGISNAIGFGLLLMVIILIPYP